MTIHKFSELKDKMSPERREKLEMDLQKESAKLRESLIESQAIIISKLEADLVRFVEDGNEYLADCIRQELLIQRSLARLIHKPTAKE
jgi:hypothetical protein